jgi:DNA repair protein RecO
MITTQSIILSIRENGDAHRAYSMYTRDHGKVDVLATGVRKKGSKFAGHLTGESILRCTFFPGRDRMRLIHCVREQGFPALRKDLLLLGLAHAAREVVDRMTRPGITDARIFELLERLFTGLEAHSADPRLLFQVFLHHFFDALGLRALPRRKQASHVCLKNTSTNLFQAFSF